MMEILIPLQEVSNTKERITIDLIKDGEEFLKKFELNQEIILDSISLVYRYLRITGKIPHNTYKFFIAAYYIITRHPLSFPAHESKKKFCHKFGIELSSLDYSVDKLVMTLNYIKILDDKNYPYFIDPSNDLGLKIAKNFVKTKVEKALMNFYLLHQAFNSQIICEEIVTSLIFEMNLFPQELLRQYYEIIFEFIESILKNQYYEDYIKLQRKYLI